MIAKIDRDLTPKNTCVLERYFFNYGCCSNFLTTISKAKLKHLATPVSIKCSLKCDIRDINYSWSTRSSDLTCAVFFGDLPRVKELLKS